MDDSLTSTGILKSLDNSILTDDTEDLMVGDRVWVNGVRPGHIQFIGETKFAPGEWAGIVLDEPIGKNNGSINGVRYFQCEPRRGIFARLHRLTRYPCSDAIEPANQYVNRSRTTTPDGRIKTTRVCVSPVPSYAMPARPEKVHTTVTTTTTTIEGNPNSLRCGDKVMVNSSRGMLIGRIRYLGKADFAPGHWVGIHLDEPLGRNDGSVAGKRYFSCPHKYGLFAPMYKVVRTDPAKSATITRITNTTPTKTTTYRSTRVA